MTEEQKAKEAKEEKKELSSDELNQLVEKDKAKRLHDCQRDLEKVLQKYNCQLLAVPQLVVDGHNQRYVTIAEVHVKVLL